MCKFRNAFIDFNDGFRLTSNQCVCHSLGLSVSLSLSLSLSLRRDCKRMHDLNKPFLNFPFVCFADDLSPSQKPEWTPESIDDEYGRICKNMGALPSGKFKRQISCPVADMSYSLLGTKDIKSISVALTVN